MGQGRAPKVRSVAVLAAGLIFFLTSLHNLFKPWPALLSPLFPLRPLEESKGTREVFGFVPYWNINKLESVDFETLTTLAYFGVPVRADGNLDKGHYGWEVFEGRRATDIFKKAHSHGTRVVLTLTQMDAPTIRKFLDNTDAQATAIARAVMEVQSRGIDGINVDFEYVGNPGRAYRDKFTAFVAQTTEEMHRQNPHSQVTVSVFASSVKEPKIYDIGELAKVTDGIFMMAYDYAAFGAQKVMPTAPLYGYKEGKYWYDVATAVEDFLTQMPAEKLILGMPWYGYDYAVTTPEVNGAISPGYSYLYKKWYTSRGRRLWSWARAWSRPRVYAQPYSEVLNNIKPDSEDITEYKEGWDDAGKVGWKAYKNGDGVWRMLFLEDKDSLAFKYDFARQKRLGGVGFWALGYENGRSELWQQLRKLFGPKPKDFAILRRAIAGEE